MFDQLEDLYREIRETADDAGLAVFDGSPDLRDVPTATWSGDWRPLIDLAHKAGAALVYLEVVKYDPDTLIENFVDELTPRYSEPQDDDELEPVIQEDDWLRQRLYEAVAPWDTYREHPMGVYCIWFKDGVAHRWHKEADWTADHHSAFQDALDEAQQVERRKRAHRSVEAEQKLHYYANLLAIHPRFPEAKSEEKREFMVARMFGDDLRKEPLSYQIFPHSIAHRASLIYWWDIEPSERATIEERARQLRDDGMSIKNIAATLHISEAKVRAALNG
jgi:hypothetical protein